MPLTRRTLAALAGITAAAAALGVAQLVAALVGPRSAPLVAVGGVVVDGVPGPVKDLAVRLFGTHDKLALIVGTVVLLAIAAAVVGVLAARRAWYGYAGIALFAVLGVAAALTRHQATWAAAGPSLLGAATAAGVLWLLQRLLPPAVASVAAREAVGVDLALGEPRRRFLRAAGALLAGAAVTGLAGRWLTTRLGVARERAAIALPSPASADPPPPADPPVAGITPFVTSNRAFYRIDTALTVPQVDLTTWRLRIHGRVRQPLTLTYDELLARPMIERYTTLACVSNEVGGSLISNARWLGTPLRDLLDEVQPAGGADQVVSRSVDGFTAGTPTAALRDGRDALLAVGMNGQPLPVEHGFPVRMVVPGLYGYVSATKWLAELELTAFDAYDAYWVRRGWAKQAPVKTASRIDTPRNGTGVPAGRVVVAGVAWAQHRGIAAVEVRVDGGDWQRVSLSPVPSIDTWRQWTWSWSATAGRHRIEVRATDDTGAVQTQQERPPVPDGATGWHRVEVTVR